MPIIFIQKEKKNPAFRRRRRSAVGPPPKALNLESPPSGHHLRRAVSSRNLCSLITNRAKCSRSLTTWLFSQLLPKLFIAFIPPFFLCTDGLQPEGFVLGLQSPLTEISSLVYPHLPRRPRAFRTPPNLAAFAQSFYTTSCVMLETDRQLRITGSRLEEDWSVRGSVWNRSIFPKFFIRRRGIE